MYSTATPLCLPLLAFRPHAHGTTIPHTSDDKPTNSVAATGLVGPPQQGPTAGKKGKAGTSSPATHPSATPTTALAARHRRHGGGSTPSLHTVGHKSLRHTRSASSSDPALIHKPTTTVATDAIGCPTYKRGPTPLACATPQKSSISPSEGCYHLLPPIAWHIHNPICAYTSTFITTCINGRRRIGCLVHGVALRVADITITHVHHKFGGGHLPARHRGDHTGLKVDWLQPGLWCVPVVCSGRGCRYGKLGAGCSSNGLGAMCDGWDAAHHGRSP